MANVHGHDANEKRGIRAPEIRRRANENEFLFTENEYLFTPLRPGLAFVSIFYYSMVD
jgi:hypothetical protein